MSSMSSDQVARLAAKFDAETIISAMSEIMTDERKARLDEVVAGRLRSVTVVFENLYDPHNGAAALRSCEALGIDTIHIVGDRMRFSDKVTQGSHKWLRLVHHASLDACVAALRAEDFQLVAAVPGAAVALDALPCERKTAFLLGNEHAGLSDAARAACDVEYTIPMAGFSESFNLSVATAISLYSFTQRRRGFLGARGDLSAPDQLALRAAYYGMDVRGADLIIDRYRARTAASRSLHK